MKQIICMLARDSSDNDLFESSGALFRKLAEKNNTILYGFFSANYSAYENGNATVLLTSKDYAQHSEDSDICLYINSHGVGGKIAGGEAGAVAVKIISALKLKNAKFIKIVFLACKLATPENVTISLKTILEEFNGLNVHKIVVYKSAMTILSPRNLKFIVKAHNAGAKVNKPQEMSGADWNSFGRAAAQNVNKEKNVQTQRHLDWYKNIVASFKADLISLTGSEDLVTAFFSLSHNPFGEDAPLIWDAEGAPARTSVDMKPTQMTDEVLTHLHSKFDPSVFGRRITSTNKAKLNKDFEAFRFENSPIGVTSGQVAGPESYNGCNGYVYTESDGLKVVWEIEQRPEDRAFQSLSQCVSLLAKNNNVGAGNLYIEAKSILPFDRWTKRMLDLNKAIDLFTQHSSNLNSDRPELAELKLIEIKSLVNPHGIFI